MTELFNNLSIALVCRAARVPLIFSMHTDLAKLRGGPAFVSNLSVRHTASLATVTVTTSPSFRTVMQAAGVTRCSEFYQPVPCDGIARQYEQLSPANVTEARARLSNGQSDRKLLVYVGRWSHEKRMQLLVKSLPPNTMLSFVGDGKIGDDVQQWADADSRIVCCRGMVPRDQLAVIYAAADWVVSASDFETFGNVPFEAAHCGTPALLQHAQGFVDQIDEEEHRGALLDFAADDAMQQLEAAMKRTDWLLDRPDVVQAAALRQAQTGTTIGDLARQMPTRLAKQPPAAALLYLVFALLLSASFSVFCTLCKPVCYIVRDSRQIWARLANVACRSWQRDPKDPLRLAI